MCDVFAEPGAGRHHFPRRLVAERDKQLAEIFDPLGAGENVAQHPDPAVKEEPKVRLASGGLCTELRQAGTKTCGVSRAAHATYPSTPQAARHAQLRAFSRPDLPIHRAQGQRSPTRADRSAYAPRAELAGHGQGIIGFDVAIHGVRSHFGIELRRENQGNTAIHRAELELVGPVGATHLRIDRAIHGRRLGEAGRGDAHAAVHRARAYISLETFSRHLAIYGLAVEFHTGRDLHFEVDFHVVVLGAGVPAVARFAGIFVAGAPRRRIDGADRDAVRILDDFDLHLIRIGAMRDLLGVYDCLAARGVDRADIAGHPLHFEPF